MWHGKLLESATGSRIYSLPTADCYKCNHPSEWLCGACEYRENVKNLTKEGDHMKKIIVIDLPDDVESISYAWVRSGRSGSGRASASDMPVRKSAAGGVTTILWNCGFNAALDEIGR